MEFTNPLPFRHQREVNLPKPLEIPQAQPVKPPHLADVERAMDLYPRSNSLPSIAPRPRSPLPPHKLAKLANALGVSTPMPAFYRSPSPSGSSSLRTPSRYLLHVVPPAYLPSDDDDDGPDPEGASAVSASSYRSQFRRGTLIPLYPTLQSQLGAIAREYSLPSTGGLVLYLVQSSQGGALDGPRISDDVWKLLWYKALQAERQDVQPRTASSLDFRSGRSTPSSPFNRDNSQPLPATSRPPPSPFPYPSPSTSSTPSSEAHLPLPDRHQVSSPDLQSISSDFAPNPFLPILAKVEFDIDRRKAGWFDAWSHGKRERSRWRNGTEGGKIQLELPQQAQSRTQFRNYVPSEESSEYALLDDGEGENTAVDDDELDQATVVARHLDPLADVFGNDAMTWSEMQAGRQDKGATGLDTSVSHPELVYPDGNAELDEERDEGHDEDDVVKIWDENHRPTLSLDSPDPRIQMRKGIPPPLHLMSSPVSDSPTLSPGPPTGNSYLPYLSSTSPLGSDTGSSGSEINGGDRRTRRRTGMVFGDLEVKIVAEPEQMSDAEIIAHRSSQIVMKHKLDQLERQLAELSPRHLNVSPPPIPPNAPEFDPETDRPLRSAPPGVDRFTLSPPKHVKATHSMSMAPRRSGGSSPLMSTAPASMDQFPPRKDSLTAASQMQSPKLQDHKRGRSSQSSSSGSSSKSLHEPAAPGTAWPAVAYASITKPLPVPASPPSRPSTRLQERSPPQLTLKRASGGLRKADSIEVSEETHARALELEEGQEVLHPGPMLSGNPNSPIIPLSPDPFGKRPVEDLRQRPVEDLRQRPVEDLRQRPSEDNSPSVANGSRPPSRLQGTVLPASVPEDAEMETQSSRFSADSEQGVEQLAKQRRSRTNSIMSVRSLRNLWRKSNASSKGGALPPPPVPSELSPSLPPSRPQSQHSRGESSASQRSMRQAAERPRRPSVAPRPDSGSDPFQFDNANIYKSPSSSSLASAGTPTTSSGPNYAAGVGSIGQSKGILKGWNGNANPSDAEARRMRRPSLANLRRSMSTASASASLSEDQGERSADSQSSPPSSPPDPRPPSVKHKQAPSVSTEPAPLAHSLPTSSAFGLSRYPEARPSTSSSSGISFDESSTPRLSQFEIVSPPMRSTGLAPSASYNGEVS